MGVPRVRNPVSGLLLVAFAIACTEKETVPWYVKMLSMDFVLGIAEDQVPST